MSLLSVLKPKFTGQMLPYFSARVPAGFPSPAEEYAGSELDINELLIDNPPATFMVRVSGDSMIGAGIMDGDYLVVDKSRQAKHGDIVIAFVNNEMLVKRLYHHGQIKLVSENVHYPPIIMSDGMTLNLWGVVSGVIRKTI